MFRFVDLFCGIGGFRVALQREGMECVFSSDIDPYVQDVYEDNFGERPLGDITGIQEDEIPEHDILCAGFPCQSFSRSGNRLGLADERGRLFYDIVRIAKHHKPLVLLLENVKTILTLDNGKVISTIENRLDRIGYRVHYHVLNSSEYGIPQKRERVYFACLRKDAPLKYQTPIPSRKVCSVADILLPNDQCDDLIVNRPDIHITKDDLFGALAPIRIGYLNKGGQGERIYSTKGHAITLSANGGGAGARTGLYLVDDKVRKLHITEAKRLMGFDEAHKVSSGIQGYKQLGNAVIPQMINNVYEGIRVT